AAVEQGRAAPLGEAPLAGQAIQQATLLPGPVTRPHPDVASAAFAVLRTPFIHAAELTQVFHVAFSLLGRPPFSLVASSPFYYPTSVLSTLGGHHPSSSSWAETTSSACRANRDFVATRKILRTCAARWIFWRTSDTSRT